MEKIETEVELMALLIELQEYKSRHKAVKRYIDGTTYADKKTILDILGLKENEKPEVE